MPVVVALSLIAAFLLAASAALQQRAAIRTRFATRSDQAQALPGLGLLAELLRDRLWLLGWAANVSGFLVQALALHQGSVATVQPLMVTQLLFALPLGMIGTDRRLSRGAWWGAGAVCAGLAVLMSVRGELPTASEVNEPRLLAVVVMIAFAAGVLATLSLGRPPAVRAVLFGTAAGLYFALSAVFMKQTFGQLTSEGVAATATDWFGYGLAGSTLASLLLGQAAFASGPMAPAVTAMNITNPLVSYVLAVLVYSVPAPSGAGDIAGVTVGGLLIAVGVALLSRSPTLTRPGAAPREDAADGRASRRRASGGGVFRGHAAADHGPAPITGPHH